MGIFESRTELKTKLEKAENALETLKAESTAKITEFESKYKDYVSAEDHKKVLADNEQLNQDIVELKKQLDEAKIVNANKVEEQASLKAKEIVQSQASAPVRLDPTNTTDIAATFTALKGVEARKFWEQNREKLSAVKK